MSITNEVSDQSVSIEARIVELASQIAGATCELLLLVAEFDAVNGAGSWGLPSTAHWLSYKCGTGLVTAREQVRVARKLRALPALAREFAAGRLSYCKVRAITRVAIEDNLQTLIGWATHATGAQLERIIAGYRTANRAEDVRAQHAQRSLTWHWDGNGCLVGTFRLAPDAGARFVAAVKAAQHRAPEPVAQAEAVEADSVPGCERCTEVAAARCPEADPDAIRALAKELCVGACA